MKWEIIFPWNIDLTIDPSSNIDLTIDPSSNKCRTRNELREVLKMTDINQRYFVTNFAEAKSIRDYLAERFREERQSYKEQ